MRINWGLLGALALTVAIWVVIFKAF